MGQRSTWGCPEGGTTHQGTPEAPFMPKWVVPRWVVPTSVASRTPSLPYKFTNIPKPFWVDLDQKFHHHKASISMRSNLEAFSGTLTEGSTITKGFFIITTDLWVGSS